MAGLADQLIAGPVSSLESAAAWRRQDAETLLANGRRCGGLYLLGYAAEIRLCAATYHVLGFDAKDVVSDAQRRFHERQAQAAFPNPSGPAPHYLPGWARYLSTLRRARQRALSMRLCRELWSHSDDLFEQWRPRLRYKAIVPTLGHVQVVRLAVDWLETNYSQLWS